MSKPVVLNYTAPVANALVDVDPESIPNGSFLQLKASSPYAPVPGGTVFFPQLQRQITISSPANIDNSNVTFVVTGTQLGSNTIITEDIAGPAGLATVTSANQYHSIISIQVTINPANQVEVGTAAGATFEWQPQDTYRQFAQYSLQGVVGGAGGAVSYSVLQTLDNPQNTPASIAGFQLDNTVTTPWTASQFYSFAYPVAGLQLIVNPTGTNATGTLVFTILQQGVR